MSSRRSRLLSPTFASASRSKAVTRDEVSDLQSSVRKLAKSNAVLSTATDQTLALAPDVQALRRAYSQLSEVVVEENETLRADIRTLKTQLAMRAQESQDAMAAVQQLTKEMRALREELGATRAELAEVRDAAATRVAVAELHDEVSVVRGDVRDAHDRLVGMAAVPGAVDSNSSAIRTLQRDAEDSRASTKAVVEATEIVTQELSHQHQQLSELRAAHQSAASALAQDVAMLADSLAAHKSRTSKEHEDATARCREMEETVDAGRRTDASVLESKLAAVNRQLAAHQDTLRQGLAAMQQQQDRTTAAVHDGVAAAAADAKTVSSVSRALESKVKDQVAAVQRQVLEHHDEYQRQLASVTAAIRAFADVMHVTPPLSALR